MHSGGIRAGDLHGVAGIWAEAPASDTELLANAAAHDLQLYRNGIPRTPVRAPVQCQNTNFFGQLDYPIGVLTDKKPPLNIWS